MAQDGGVAAPPTRTPFERTGAFLALSVALVLGAGGLGFAIGNGGGGSVGGGKASPGPDQAALVALLPNNLYRNCQPRDLSEGQVASVTCDSGIDGADELIASRYATSEAMSADFTSTYRDAYPDGKCSEFTGGKDARGKGVTSTYQDGDPLACYVNSNGDATLLWEYPEQRLQSIAIRKDADSKALFDWWIGKAVKVPRAQ